jgi:hypothetical protein
MNNLQRIVQYIEHTNEFVTLLLSTYQQVERREGRRFDRIVCDNKVMFFIDKITWDIYGAKSSFQHNARRVYGTIDTSTQWDWAALRPLPNTDAANRHTAREHQISQQYKKRGRPRKVSLTLEA